VAPTYWRDCIIDTRKLSGTARLQHNTELSRPTQTERARVRHFLTTSAFASSTVTAYLTAVTRFRSYCPHQGRHSSVSQLDRCVEDYICDLFLFYLGRNRQLAVNTVYGLYMQQPVLRDRLKGSEGLLRGWQRAAPSVQHPPLTWPITVAIARTMAANGYPVCALATLVAFDGLLRVGELVSVRVSDVSLPHDSRRGSSSATLRTSSSSSTSSTHPSLRRSSSAFIRLGHAKTGTNQTAEISNPDIISLLQRYVDSGCGSQRGSSSRLFSLPSSSPADYYRSVLRSACHALDIGEFNFTPHSLRHGGATHAHMHMGETIEHVLYRGRWQSNSSARVYLQQGAAALITTQLSQRAQDYVQHLQTEWLEHIWSDCVHSLTHSS
jgi:integrase